MKVARIRISEQLLLQVLHLPSGTTIVGASYDESSGYGDVDLLVSHADLKDVDSSEPPPMTTPTWTRQPEIVFNGWGQEEPAREMELEDRAPYCTGYKA